MLTVEIPHFGLLNLKYLVSDFTGTLSVGGKLIPGVRERLLKLTTHLEIHILTADTFGVVQRELAGIPVKIQILGGGRVDREKEAYLKKMNPQCLVAIGNGNNDHLMLKLARLSIAVIEGEGCARSALLSAHILTRSINEALDLLLEPLRLVATLRF